ncbi:MAG: cytochrome c3 family protein, partial [Nitrospirota bacterium]|nr:cytochrome c3 family protein [Nitrospirota bacterium]
DPNNPVINYTNTNMEGDARNSFLRKSNSPFSDLCETCHKDKAFVDGTDHDLNITAPEAKNLLGQTVMESGQCGACHLVHNSPNKIKLWARSYGLVSRNEDIVNSLCNSCHSKGNPAEIKIPLIATHPEDRLINNIMRSDRARIDFSPIFNKTTGEETHVGNISCPSCHNAHQWSPLTKEKGHNKNMEGNATNSFLRNVSYNNICIDCHGLDALFRYKYYHDPEERIEPAPARVKFIQSP